MLPDIPKPIYSQAPSLNLIFTYWFFAICLLTSLPSKIIFLKVTSDFLITTFHVYFSSSTWEYGDITIYSLTFPSTWVTLCSDVSNCFSTDFFPLFRYMHFPWFLIPFSTFLMIYFFCPKSLQVFPWKPQNSYVHLILSFFPSHASYQLFPDLQTSWVIVCLVTEVRNLIY